MRLAAFIVVLGFSSACGSAATCDASTCAGCCSGTLCVGGTASDMCGSRGAACQFCSSGLSCQSLGGSNVCLGGSGGGAGGGSSGGGSGGGAAACGAGNCAGCCLNGACQPGNTAAACGKQGVACGGCANNQVCRVDQTCGVDPDSNWLVQPTSASVKPNNNGTSWDGDGSAPDVIIRLGCPATSMSFTNATPEVSNSYTPAWTTGGCTMKARDLLQTGASFQAFDVDLTSDDPITQAYMFKPAEANFVSGSFTTTPLDGLNSLTISLTRR